MIRRRSAAGTSLKEDIKSLANSLSELTPMRDKMRALCQDAEDAMKTSSYSYASKRLPVSPVQGETASLRPSTSSAAVRPTRLSRDKFSSSGSAVGRRQFEAEVAVAELGQTQAAVTRGRIASKTQLVGASLAAKVGPAPVEPLAISSKFARASQRGSRATSSASPVKTFRNLPKRKTAPAVIDSTANSQQGQTPYGGSAAQAESNVEEGTLISPDRTASKDSRASASADPTGKLLGQVW
eukprot:TRINITY_DN30196_c0_g1_i1.p1 TRINITY_DN30196_c0_g1~~TRINITY_DN30196_c0_g1_i1.p1  ORF type:complete len:240 (-),score=35.17 TRINITY_DN30196_c0_g1_i1:758-1477(-)